jgi:hypothetical protein
VRGISEDRRGRINRVELLKIVSNITDIWAVSDLRAFLRFSSEVADVAKYHDSNGKRR